MGGGEKIFNEIGQALNQGVMSEISVIKVRLEALLKSQIECAQLKRSTSVACNSNESTLNQWGNRLGYSLRFDMGEYQAVLLETLEVKVTISL